MAEQEAIEYTDALGPLAHDHMQTLLEAGFAVQTVLERGLTFVYDSANNGDITGTRIRAALVVREAAKHLEIDLASQHRAGRSMKREIHDMMR